MTFNRKHFYDLAQGSHPIFGRFAYDFFEAWHSQNLPNANSNGGGARPLKI